VRARGSVSENVHFSRLLRDLTKIESHTLTLTLSRKRERGHGLSAYSIQSIVSAA